MTWINLIQTCFEFLGQICFGSLNIKKNVKLKSDPFLIENAMRLLNTGQGSWLEMDN